MPTLKERTADKKTRKKFNLWSWGDAWYHHRDDTLTIDSNQLSGCGYPGVVGPLWDRDESMRLLGHFCSKVGAYFTVDQMVNAFVAVSELYDMPVSALFTKVAVNRPYREEIEAVRQTAIARGEVK